MPIGMLDVGADVLEIAAHDPQDQRQRDQLIDPDQADIGVGEAELLEIEAERQQHQQRRREAEGQQRERDVLAQPELEAGEGVGRRHAQQQRQQPPSALDSSTLFQRLRMKAISSVPALLTQLARDQRRVVGERRLEERARAGCAGSARWSGTTSGGPRRSGTGRTARPA